MTKRPLAGIGADRGTPTAARTASRGLSGEDVAARGVKFFLTASSLCSNLHHTNSSIRGGPRMMTLDEGAERLHRLTKELLRRYQFRDWNQVCCYGISISQSHILDVLADEGDLTMQELARRMFKSVSTMTRVAGQLVRKGYIKRRQDPEDRRIVHVSITPQGKAIIAAIQRDLIETQKAVLQSVPAEEWAGAFKVLEALSRGARRWQETCCKV
jgi:MarR family 2-MHQ and catechol resistance regulon transcriptional repressor